MLLSFSSVACVLRLRRPAFLVCADRPKDLQVIAMLFSSASVLNAYMLYYRNRSNSAVAERRRLGQLTSDAARRTSLRVLTQHHQSRTAIEIVYRLLRRL